MSKGNKRAKEELIRLYGAECFIDKLHFRPDTDRRYTGKAQRKKMERLTYHHIKEKSKGGQATLENGALLSQSNHEWFNSLSKEQQRELNKRFLEYKRNFGKECTVKFVDDIEIPIRVNGKVFMMTERELEIKKEQQRELQEDLLMEMRY